MSAVKKLSEFELARAGKQIRGLIEGAETSARDADAKRLKAGEQLAEVKASLPHGAWGSWLKKNDIAERTARLCMQMARGDTTPEQVRDSVRKAVAKHARKSALANADMPKGPREGYTKVGGVYIADACEECSTPEAIWERECTSLLGDIAAMRGYFRKEFGAWEKFKVPSALAKLAKQAADEMIQLAKQLSKE